MARVNQASPAHKGGGVSCEERVLLVLFAGRSTLPLGLA